MQRLSSCRVAVFGLGGVGGYVAEALARSGVGALELVDNDGISITNLNRQIFATLKTVGKYKVDAAQERIADINPACRVTTHKIFYLPSTEKELDFTRYDYVVDAIDTVTGKLAIIKNAKAAGVPVISSMGMGNKLDPAALEVTDIYKTSVCPLARTMRRELKKLGIESLKVVCSKEEPLRPLQEEEEEQGAPNNCLCKDAAHKCAARRVVPGSTAFVPPAAGLLIASEVVKDLISK